MKLKTILTACALTGLAFAAQATNGPAGIAAPPLPHAGLPGMQATEQAPVLMAQVASPEMIQLQEQVRSLNGKVEELTFQLLQLQEQLRKMQEDNDYRFQQMEEQRGDAAPAASGRDTQVAVATPEGDDGTEQPAEAAADGLATTLGNIRFDADGNVVGSQVTAEPGANGQVPDNQQVAAIPDTADAATLYRMAYEMILNGDYASAEAAFGAHVDRFPEDAQTADARYWLGEAQLGQNKFQQAAETFLNTSRAYPDAPKSPDMLLKLGVSLAAMNNRDLACEMFAQIPSRYPDMSAALSKRLSEERARTAC